MKVIFTVNIDTRYIDMELGMKLEEEELMVLCYAIMHKNVQNQFVTSAKMLEEITPLSSNKVVKALRGLVTKDIISADSDIDKKSFVRLTLPETVNHKSGLSYVRVPFQWLHDKVFSARELYIYVLVARWHNENSPQKPLVATYSHIADLLGVGISTAQKAVREAESRGLVEVQSGDFIMVNGRPKQAPNKYFLGNQFKYWVESSAKDDKLGWVKATDDILAKVVQILESAENTEFFMDVSCYNPRTEMINLDKLAELGQDISCLKN